MQAFRLLLALIVAAFVLLGLQQLRTGWTALAPAHLAIWVFDVGQGDAIFINGPDKDILIDGGPTTEVVEKLGRVMLPWDRTIDAVVVTHPHADHVLGLNAVLERYKIGEVYANGTVHNEAPAVAFSGATETKELLAGEVIDLGNGARLQAIWPTTSLAGEHLDDPNAGSIVLMLKYGRTTMLLTGDAGVDEEEQFVVGLPKIDVLKVGHHGSETSTSAYLLNLLRPAKAIISVGEGNDYGHPSPFIIGRLENAEIDVFRTDLDGDIRILTNGNDPVVTKISL